MPGVVRIHLTPTGARVYAPRAANSVIKQLERFDRRWAPEFGCWVVATYEVERLVEMFDGSGWSARVIDAGEVPAVVLPRFGAIRGADWPANPAPQQAADTRRCTGRAPEWPGLEPSPDSGAPCGCANAHDQTEGEMRDGGSSNGT